MGCVMSLASLACCCTSSACSFCCSACPSSTFSTTTRLMYSSMLLITLLFSYLFQSPTVKGWLESAPFCKSNMEQDSKGVFHFPRWDDIGNQFKIDCRDGIGYLAVYRLCFIVFLFFTLMAFAMIGVKNSKDFRSGFQNGFWGVKYGVIILGFVASLFIPESTGSDSFSQIWMYFGFVGAIVFILFQLLIIIDFAHSWAERWLSGYEDDGGDADDMFGGDERRNGKCKLYMFIGSTLLMLGAAITFMVLSITYYTGQEWGDCKLHEAFIFANFGLCVAICVLSVHPKIQAHMPISGLLQPSLISTYVMYLTWAALYNSPHEQCKTLTFERNRGLSFISYNGNSTSPSEIIGNMSSSVVPDGAEVDLLSSGEEKKLMVHQEQPHPVDSYQTLIGLVIMVCCLIYTALSSSTHGAASAITGGGGGGATQTTFEESPEDDDGENVGQKVHDNEKDGVAYPWSVMHAVFAAATLYLMMTLTNWFQPGSSILDYQSNSGAMWMKILSAWLVVGLYVWTTVAPCLFPDRNFGFARSDDDF